MRSLDEILLGSLVFFIIDRGIRLSSNLKYGDKQTVQVLSFEMAALVVVFALVLKFRRIIGSVRI
jgi:hypothetical protein